MKKIIRILLLLILSISMTTCMNVSDRKTTLEIVDNNRHYYPILRGEILDVDFRIKNTGEVPFILTDIFTSCGCLVTTESSIDAISQGKEGILRMKYDSNKNVGHIEHYVTIYGNLKDGGKAEITFDIHVVPSSLNTREYEEIYQDEKNKRNQDSDPKNNLPTNERYYLQ